MRVRTGLLAVLAMAHVAHAQPADPYAPAPAPLVPPDQDPVLAEQIAQSLVARAQELFDARVYVEAKQLAVEAVIKSPNGQASIQAKVLIAAINKQLGIVDDAPAAPAPVNLPPVGVPQLHDRELPAQPEGGGDPSTAARVHGALFGGAIGATIGAFFSDRHPARGAVPAGIVTGLVAGLYLPRLTEKLGWTEAQVRTVGSGSLWGGVIGGLIADTASIDSTTPRQALVGTTIGATVGVIAASGLARKNQYTRGDIALVDTFAGIGAIGGLTLGMLMQPAKGEAYSLNAVVGTIGGVVTGLIAAPETNTTPRRMLRVAGTAAVGGGVPFLLYAGIHDKSSHDDERFVGALSTLGLVIGAYVGFRLTSDLDVGRDVLDRKHARDVDDAPPAVVRRSSTGEWGLGALAVQPLSLQLAPQPGLSVSIVGATF